MGIRRVSGLKRRDAILRLSQLKHSCLQETLSKRTTRSRWALQIGWRPNTMIYLVLEDWYQASQPSEPVPCSAMVDPAPRRLVNGD